MKLQTESAPYKQLTHEVITPISGRAVALTVVGTLFFLILINWGVSWLDRTYPENRGYWLVRQKWELLYDLEEPVDWLILGDSTGNQGLMPEILTEQLGGTAVNLNTIGHMGVVDDAWMLAEYVERFGPPSHVLIVHTFDVWPRDVIPVLLAKTPLAWGSWQDEYLPSISLTDEEARDIWLTRYFPLYANNISLGEAIQNWVFDGKPILVKRFQLQADGFMPLYEVPPTTNIQAKLNDSLHYVRNNNFTLSEENSQALEQLVLLAETHEINMYIASGPLYEKLAEDAHFQNYYAEVRAGLREITDQSGYVHLLETTAVFPANQLENVDHVIFEAAKVYTTMIANEIEEKWP